MPTMNQLVRKGRKSKKNALRTPALKVWINNLKNTKKIIPAPQKRATVLLIKTVTPRKPNSALRKVARLRVSNGYEVTTHIPGEGHNLQEHANVFLQGKKVPDLAAVSYNLIRSSGKGDLPGVNNRKQGRSLYGTKKDSNKKDPKSKGSK